MLKWIKLSILWSLVLFFFLFTTQVQRIKSETNKDYKVVLDAGHGGYDGGAEGPHSVEKEINLQVALYLRQYLTDLGIEVLMIRDKDEAFANTRGHKKRSDLSYRVEMINSANATLFVSIHMNAMPDSRWRGAQTFYHPGNEDSKRLATIIQSNLKHTLKNTTRKEKAMRSIYILKNINIPGVLIEAGFLSNPEEEKLLLDPHYQQKLANAIFLGIVEYLGEEVL